ncbi:ATP-dependent protease subunit [Acinetobacter phage vB_AbaM_B9]|nr:ATP-dependent protease subunit [Acinetobacter phage vB_AbaM_B9]
MILGRHLNSHEAPRSVVPDFTPPSPRPTRLGIYDGQKSNPTIHGVFNGGFKYIVNITDDFDSPDCYSEVIALLSTATEQDEIWWNIASYGGFVDSLNMLLGWKSMCPAQHVHILHANADSCASAFFLSSADKYIVGDHATMMIHEFQVGNGGTTSNVRKRVEHTSEENEKFVTNTYKHFLSEREIDQVLQGVEFYFSSDEIRDRLQHRENEKIKERMSELDKPLDLSQYTDEELESELSLYKEDVKMIQNELKKRKK